MTPGTLAGDASIREVIEELGAYDRRAGSSGEHRAAAWIARRLRSVGCDADIEIETFYAGYAGLMRALSILGSAAGITALAVRGLRPLAAAAAGTAGVMMADDVSNGPRVARRLIARREETWNVVGTVGDSDAPRTLVVLAHHDAAPTGAIFDDTVQAWLAERIPGLMERADTSVPVWWGPLAAQGLIAVGAVRGRAPLVGLGLFGTVVSAAAFHDIARSPVVPGANDNLTAVAVLVALAERLRENPVTGLRVMLVSCGAEEVIQGGIHGFGRRHFPQLDRERTYFLNLETIGSPTLIMLEGEGPVVMEDYHERGFRDLIALAAVRAGAPLVRGIRARSSTDAVVPSRARYPTATLASMDRYKRLSNYHLMTDTPENIVYRTVSQALVVTEAVARELASTPWLP